MNGGQGIVDIININGQQFARKYMLSENLIDIDSIHRFKREMEIINKIDSINVIKIIDTGIDNRGPYYTMPLYQENLYEYICRNKPEIYENPISQKTIILSVLNGVKELHDAGIIHRDLKPANILLNGIDDIVICDFGFSKDIMSLSSCTSTGDRFGTERYISPEQIRDSKHVDNRTDIYALGQILNDLIGRGVSSEKSELCRVADKAIAYNLNDRYNNISEFIKDINSAYKLWMYRNERINVSVMIDDISFGKMPNMELISCVEHIINNPNYMVKDADTLLGVVNKVQYKSLEKNNIELCERLFERYWDDWYNTWNGRDYYKIDDVCSLVTYYWSISESPKIKGYNLAKLAELAKTGNRYPAMEAMSNLIIQISDDEEIKKVLMHYTSAYTLRSNFKKIGKTPPSWL